MVEWTKSASKENFTGIVLHEQQPEESTRSEAHEEVRLPRYAEQSD